MTAACVYTALIGNYEPLNEQPVARRSGLDFICFTDDAALESETWKIIQVEPSLPMDPVRSARALKILGRHELDQYDQTIWIDNSVVLLEDPSFLLAQVRSTPLALLDHAFRDTVREEFAEVIALNYDDQARILEQLNSYSLLDPEVLDERPFWSSVIVRRLDSELTATMRLWMDHVLRYSRRDQLSVNFVLASTSLPVTRMHADLRACHWASWPHTLRRDRDRGLRKPLTLQQEPRLLAGEILRREQLLEQRLAEADEARDAAERGAAAASAAAATAAAASTDAEAASAAELEQARGAIAQAERNLAACRIELEQERRAVAGVLEANRDLRAALEDLRASRSWRLTGVLRRIGTTVRRWNRPRPIGAGAKKSAGRGRSYTRRP